MHCLTGLPLLDPSANWYALVITSELSRVHRNLSFALLRGSRFLPPIYKTQRSLKSSIAKVKTLEFRRLQHRTDAATLGLSGTNCGTYLSPKTLPNCILIAHWNIPGATHFSSRRTPVQRLHPVPIRHSLVMSNDVSPSHRYLSLAFPRSSSFLSPTL